MNTWQELREVGMERTLDHIKQAFLSMCKEKTTIRVPTDGYAPTEEGLVELIALPPVALPQDDADNNEVDDYEDDAYHQEHVNDPRYSDYINRRENSTERPARSRSRTRSPRSDRLSRHRTRSPRDIPENRCAQR